MAGCSPSLVRAGSVTLLSLVFWYYGRRFHPLRILVYAAAVSLFVDPRYIGTIAWQLSFSAYAGIILLTPILSCYFYGKKRPGFLAGSILSSISAQAFCLPLGIYYFGKLPLLGIVMNLLISPTIAYVMALSIFVVVVSFIPLASRLCLYCLEFILGMHIWLIEQANGWGWASLELKMSIMSVVVYYLTIFTILTALKRKLKFHYIPRHELAKNEKYGKIYSC